VTAVLRHLSRANLIAAMLMYGAGLRLLECLTLRVKDIDFGYRQITVREGKGNKDRITVLPASIEPRLKLHLEDVRVHFEKDLKEDCGYVRLPKALGRKYPNADHAWGWQWVFPAHRHYLDPESGFRCLHHLDESVLQRAVKEAASLAGIKKSCHLPHIPPLFRHPPARGRIRHQDDPGATGASGRQHDDDLHPCPQPRRALCTKSDGHPAINLSVAYHHSPNPVSSQPITPILLPPPSPTIRSQADSRIAGNLPDIDGLPARALILPTNTAPSQSNLS